jgi:hypothetical protein
MAAAMIVKRGSMTDTTSAIFQLKVKAMTNPATKVEK